MVGAQATTAAAPATASLTLAEVAGLTGLEWAT